MNTAPETGATPEELARLRAELAAERRAFAGVRQVERRATALNERLYCAALCDELAAAHPDPTARAALAAAAATIRARDAT